MKTMTGGREEWTIEGLQPAREIKWMMGEKGGETDKEEAKARETFETGVSVEGEFAFAKAVGSYCKEAVREGRFKRSYKLNIREQLVQRATVEKRKNEKVKLVIMGGSQMGRIAQEL